MGKESDAAPTPDPNIKKAANAQASTGESWLNFATDAYATAQDRQTNIDATAQAASDSSLATQTSSTQNAATDRATYESTFTPLLNNLTEEALAAGSDEAQASAAASAAADTQQSITAQNAATQRQQASMGVNPNSGRFQGTQRASDLNSALAVAGSKNDARQQERDNATALKTNAANLAATTNESSQNYSNIANSSGAAATSALTSANEQSLAANDIMNTGYAGQMEGYAGQASTLGNLYNSEVSAYNSEQQADAASTAGLYGAIGTGVGLLTKFSSPTTSSSKEVKEDKREIPEGEAIVAIEAMPVEKWRYMPGIEDGGEHIGPYAEDMQRMTGLGDGKTIQLQDVLGLTMRGLQDVNRKVDRLTQQMGIGAFPGERKTEAA